MVETSAYYVSSGANVQVLTRFTTVDIGVSYDGIPSKTTVKHISMILLRGFETAYRRSHRKPVPVIPDKLFVNDAFKDVALQSYACVRDYKKNPKRRPGTILTDSVTKNINEYRKEYPRK